jgi:hypothetical protein
MELLFNMPTLPTIPTVATPSVSLPQTPSVSGVSVPKIPEVKTPKLPTIPTKIDVTTGKGVPGGFSAENVKVPSIESSKYAAANAKLSSQMSKVNSLSATSPEAAAKLSPIKSQLQSNIDSNSKKLTDIKKSAPDFTNPASVPKLPPTPEIKVPDLKLPDLPPAPTLPSTPSLPIGG